MVTEYTDISCCSLALTKVGANPINSFEDLDDISGLCSRVYPVIRDSLLSRYSWTFARKKRKLAIDATVTPENEWQRAFALPSDMLTGPSAVFGDGSGRPTSAHEAFGNHLYCDYQTVIIDYKFRPDVANWPVYFYELVATAMAAEIAIPVTDSSGRADEMRITAYGPAQLGGNGGLFAEAKKIDAQNQPTKSIFQNGNPLALARMGRFR